MTNAAIIRIDGETIEQLINNGALQVEGLTGAAKVMDMWLERKHDGLSTLHVSIEGEGSPKVYTFGDFVKDFREQFLSDLGEPLDKNVSCC